MYGMISICLYISGVYVYIYIDIYVQIRMQIRMQMYMYMHIWCIHRYLI